MEITIFTPTYNRKELLPALYDSICKAHQYNHCKDKVEWMIVDDGSSMDIKVDIDKFDRLKNMSITFVRKENGGKHTAFNTAIDLCCGDLFVCIDDDDRLTENAIKDMVMIASDIGICEKDSKYGAFVGRVINEKNEVLGKNNIELPLVSNTIEIRDKYKFWGEPEVYSVNKLKEYRFPVFDNEKFLTEAYLFDEMSKNYPFFYTNTILMKKEYLAGGLTDRQLEIRINSPIGTEEYYFRRKNICSGFKNILKATINRQRFAYWCKKKKHRKCDMYEILAFPLSLAMYLNDKDKYHRGKMN